MQVAVIDYPWTCLPADVARSRIGADMVGIAVTDLEDRPVMLPHHAQIIQAAVSLVNANSQALPG